MRLPLHNKILTGFRISPQLKALAIEIARNENRTLSNYIERLIQQDMITRGEITPERQNARTPDKNPFRLLMTENTSTLPATYLR